MFFMEEANTLIQGIILSESALKEVRLKGGNVSSKASGGGAVTALMHDASSVVIFSMCVCLCVGSCFVSVCVFVNAAGISSLC